MTLITDEKTVGETRMSIDTATSTLKNDILKDIEKNKPSDPYVPYKYISPRFQLSKKLEYTTGKLGIGPFALNNAHHVLTQLAGLEFNTSKLLEKYNISNLSGIYGKDGKRILDWLSAMINAFVDVAKDPYIVRLNVNQYTYNMCNFLLRTGIGDSTFYFLSQDILKDVANAVNNTNGRYGIDINQSKSNRRKEAIKKVLKQYETQARLKATDNNQVAMIDQILKQSRYNIDLKLLSGNMLTRKWLRKYTNIKSENKDFNYYYDQLRIFKLFDALSVYSDALSEMVQVSQIDTKKYGNNLTLLKSFGLRINRFLNNNSVFTSTSLNRYWYDGFLDVKTNNSINLAKGLFQNLVIKGTHQFSKYHNLILNLLGISNYANTDMSNTVANLMESNIKINFIRQYAKDNNIDIYGLFYGENNIAKRLATLKNDILSGKYPELLDASGRINNELLNILQPVFKTSYDSFDKPNSIRIVTLSADSNIIDEAGIKYFEDLLTNDNTEISQFAKDLVVYSFIASGDNRTINSLNKFIPNSIKQDMGYVDYIRKTMDELNGDSFDYNLDDVFLNNWFNDSIVPTINTKDIVSVYSSETIKTSDGRNIPYALMFKGKPTDNYNTVNNHGDIIFTPYVKIEYGLPNNPETTVVYKYVGYELANNERFVPYYIAIDKKGVRDSQTSNLITEYGTDKSDLWYNILPNKIDISDGLSREDIIAKLNDILSKTDKRKINIIGTIKQFIESVNDEGINGLNFVTTWLPWNTNLSDTELLPDEQSVDNADVVHNANELIVNKSDEELSNEATELIGDNTEKFTWSRYSNGEENYEVSSRGDRRFSALYAKFEDNTIIDGVDVSGMTIEDVYQFVIKKSKKGQAPSKDSKLYNESLKTNEDRENFSYTKGYLPLWQEWARQHPELINELRIKAKGKVLTDQFANTRVSQARALADILNDNSLPDNTSETSEDNIVTDVKDISNNTASYNVELTNGSKDFWSRQNQWGENNPTGIKAYRKYGGNKYSFTKETVEEGWIGNPFSVNQKGEDTVQKFFDWLVTGNNFGEVNATEEFRQAIINRILTSSVDTPILYYTELNRPSHATVIGYLINNKELLNGNKQTVTEQNTENNIFTVPFRDELGYLMEGYFDTYENFIKASSRQLVIPNTPEIQAEEKSVNTVVIGDVLFNLSKLGINFKLNEQQVNALNTIASWLKQPSTRTSNPFYTLVGYAGTGKTTIMRVLLAYIEQAMKVKNRFIKLAAPTHKAKMVLQNATGMEAMTIHQLLGLKADYNLDNYQIGDVDFNVAGSKLPINQATFVIIDEVSMVNDNLINDISAIAKDKGIKVILVGDKAQLEPVNQGDVSIAFKNPNVVELDKVERQKDSNPLLVMLDYMRGIFADGSSNFVHQSKLNENGDGILFADNTKDGIDILNAMVNMFSSDRFKTDLNYVKALAWTNGAVTNINNAIRKSMGYTDELNIGEPVSMYYTIEVTDDMYLYNSMDYRITDSGDATEKIDLLDIELNGKSVSLLDESSNMEFGNIFIVTDRSKEIEIAKAISAKLEGIYALRNTISDKELKIKLAKFWSKLNSSFLTTFPITHNGRTIKNKAIDYSYAITVHKSQGSTYNNVFVSEADINNNSNTRNRNQLKYVALSRASETAVVITNNDVVNDYNGEHYDINVLNERKLESDMINNYNIVDENRSDYDDSVMKHCKE